MPEKGRSVAKVKDWPEGVDTIAVYDPKDHGLGPWRITVEMGEVRGRLECLGLHVKAVAPSRAPITPSTMRHLSLGVVLQMVRETQDAPGDYTADEEEQERRRQQLERRYKRIRARAGRPPEYGPDHFVEVASVYASAYKQGANPTQAVANRWRVSASSAAKWVSRCRNEFGLLAPTRRGKAAGAAPSRKPRRKGAKR